MAMRTSIDSTRRRRLGGILLLPRAGAWVKPVRPLAQVCKDTGCDCSNERDGSAKVYQTYR